MKIFKKPLFASTLSILLAFTLLSSCSERQAQTNDSAESTIANTDIVSYCAKEKSKENRIFFNYPQFKETAPNADKINQQILEFVENALPTSDDEGFKGNLKDSAENWEWNEDEYTFIATNISYNITRNDADYFSVTFEGMFNHKRLPHPSQKFYALTFDKSDGKMVFIDDLYCIDDD